MFSTIMINGIVKQFFFALTRYVYLSLRCAFWWITGSSKPLDTYETSAHVERINWRSKIDIFESVRPYHFIGEHLRFDHPTCVLADDVILMCITADQAIFLRMPNTVWHYAADKVPFCWIALYQEAIETITLPISSLHRLADELGPVKQPSLIITNQGRCGSTLLSKLMYLSDPRVLAINEPDPLICLQDMIMHRRKLGSENFLRIVRSALRLSFKPVTGADAIVIKVRMSAMKIIRYISQATPEIKHIYMERNDVLKAVQSYERAFTPAWQARLFMFLGRSGLLKMTMGHVFQVEDEAQEIVCHAIDNLDMNNRFECMLTVWADNACAYKQIKHEVDFHTVVYENLLAKPEETLRKAFQHLGFEPKELQTAIDKGFSSDSQKNTPFSMEAISNKKPSPYTPDVAQRVRKFLNIVGLPYFEKD